MHDTYEGYVLPHTFLRLFCTVMKVHTERGYTFTETMLSDGNVLLSAPYGSFAHGRFAPAKLVKKPAGGTTPLARSTRSAALVSARSCVIARQPSWDAKNRALLARSLYALQLRAVISAHKAFHEQLSVAEVTLSAFQLASRSRISGSICAPTWCCQLHDHVPKGPAGARQRI